MIGTRFKLYPQPGFLEEYSEPEIVYVSSPAGSLMPGPADHRMYTQFPIGKEQSYGIAAKGDEELAPPWRGRIHEPAMPDKDGNFDYLEPGTPQFECAHLFGTTRFVMDIWEDYFGREIPWHSNKHYDRLELTILPTLDNAYSGYGFLELGADTRSGSYEPYSLNFDVIAHEVGHAFIYSEVGVPNPETATGEYAGFHESAADLVALISSLHFNSLVDNLLDNTRGNLYTRNVATRIVELAGNNQIRIAAHNIKLRKFACGWVKEHKLSEPLTGAFFDILVDIYHDLLVQYGCIPPEMEDLSDKVLKRPDYIEIMQPMFDEAYGQKCDSFKQALLDARDIMGAYLAQTWQLLDAHNLRYIDVATIFEIVDKETSGGRFKNAIRGNFDMRDIGWVEVGPQLEPYQKDSHTNSIRTKMPLD